MVHDLVSNHVAHFMHVTSCKKGQSQDIQTKGYNCLLFHSNQHGTPLHMNLLEGGSNSFNYFSWRTTKMQVRSKLALNSAKIRST